MNGGEWKRQENNIKKVNKRKYKRKLNLSQSCLNVVNSVRNFGTEDGQDYPKDQDYRLTH